MEHHKLVRDKSSVNSDDLIDSIMESFIISSLSENYGDNHQEQQQGDKKPKLLLTLSIELSEENDYPHPRHLCFKNPFTKTSYKKYCKKCYCYVCQVVAPCQKWNKPLKNGHCRANDQQQMWELERIRNNKVSASNITMARHTLAISFMHFPPDQTLLVNGSAGAMITDSTGKWLTGFSKHIHEDMGSHDSSVLPYMCLIEGLKLAWSRGLRYLNVHLGYLYHIGFWQDFEKDTATGRFRLRLDVASPLNRGRVWSILREVKGCLNQDWFIDVVNAPSINEESGALALAMIACMQPSRQFYDFPSHPLASKVRQIAEICKKDLVRVFDFCLPRVPGDPWKDLREYTELGTI